MKRNYLKFLAILGLSMILVACAPTQQQVAYKPAMQTKTHQSVKTRYVPVPMPGQLMKKPSKSTMKKHRALTGMAAVKAANKKAQRSAKSSQYINAIMNFDYMDGALYEIYSAPLRITDIQFEKGEHIISIAAGDTLRWQVSKTYSGEGIGRTEHLIIKPIDSELTNTLVVTTDQRTYHLLLRSTDGTYMASVQWKYPNDDGLVTNFDQMPGKNATQLPTSLGRQVNLDQLNFNYRLQLVKGEYPDWMPKMAFTDGNKTYIQFPANMQEAPTLFIGTSSGNDRVVNYRVDGNYYIVDGVINQAQLRLGQMDQTVVDVIKN